MIQPSTFSTAAGDATLAAVPAPLPLGELVAGTGDWEVEIGFGKGRYLLRRCREEADRRFLGIEVAGEYHGIFVERARRQAPPNWLAIRGDALYLASAVLPAGFASALHVYFPDPWPKSRHHKRRLFDPQTVDLVLRLLRRGGRFSFATDFLEYGERVVEILRTKNNPDVMFSECAEALHDILRAWRIDFTKYYDLFQQQQERPRIALVPATTKPEETAAKRQRKKAG